MGGLPARVGDVDGVRAAEPIYRLGNQLWRAGKLTDAEGAYREALSLCDHPDIRLNLGNVLLCQGRDREGWLHYQWRKERRASPANRLGFPEWRGESLAGKRLFIWPEQGLGDQIFAARFLARLEAEVTLVCAPALASLFGQLPVRIIPRHDPVSVRPDYDFWTLPLCLPQWVEASQPPYLSAAPSQRGEIGIMWRGNTLPDPRRSLPEAQAERLLALPGAISLHPEDTGARHFLDTAEIIAGLDETISIDTSVAHLTGALGKRGTVLLQAQQPDWRWRESLSGRSDWYPSIRLVRQASPGDWASAVDQVMRMR